MFDRPRLIIINDHSKIEETYGATIKYLAKHPNLNSSLAKTIRAYHEIGDLVPQTLDNVMSGHYFPYSESYYELENAYELVLDGFYTYAFAALRSVLELGILGVYFAIEDKEHEKVKPWVTSQQATPHFRDMLAKLSRLNYFKQFDEKFNFATRMSSTYSHLSNFIHTRGYRFSSSGQTLSNFNRFSERTLNEYSDFFSQVVTYVVITLLLKYPVGMQGLPLTEKFGLNSPAGGFLEPHQVYYITSIINEDERDFLQALSDSDSDVKKIVEHFTSLPDLSDEEWNRQKEEFDKRYPDFKNDKEKNGD